MPSAPSSNARSSLTISTARSRFCFRTTPNSSPVRRSPSTAGSPCIEHEIVEQTMARLKIGIAGGGVGGMAAAIALRQAGHDAEVYEQAVDYRRVGADINLTPNAVRALEVSAWLPCSNNPPRGRPTASAGYGTPAKKPRGWKWRRKQAQIRRPAAHHPPRRSARSAAPAIAGRDNPARSPRRHDRRWALSRSFVLPTALPVKSMP